MGLASSAFNFVRNTSLEKELVAAPAFKAAQEQWAQAVAEEAKRIAPGHQGEFYEAGADSVGMNSSIWHIIEYGSVNNIAYGVLRRAVKNSGLKLHEDPRPTHT